MKKVTKKQTILNMLLEGQSITPMQVFPSGITRLAAIVFELRASGYSIITEDVNQNGAKFARYSISKEDLKKYTL